MQAPWLRAGYQELVKRGVSPSPGETGQQVTAGCPFTGGTPWRLPRKWCGVLRRVTGHGLAGRQIWVLAGCLAT